MTSRTGCRAIRVVTLGAALVLLAPHSSVAQVAEPNVTGRVVSMSGLPVAGIEVQIDGTTLSARTDTRGQFAFTGAPGGPQDLIARGIGYLPARVPIRIPERSLDIVVTILGQPTQLDTVTVRERATVLSGIVVDERNQPVAGATVQVASTDRRTVTTGEDGWFTLTGLREGTVVFRTQKDGYFMTNTVVRLTEWRGVVVHLESLPSNMRASAQADASGRSNNAIAAWRDFALRVSMRGGRSLVLSAEDLAPFGTMALGQAVMLTKAAVHLTSDLNRARGAICVMLDGRRVVGSTTLDSWRADEIEMLELYPPGSEASGTVARTLRGAGCRALAGGAVQRGPFYAVLWIK